MLLTNSRRLTLPHSTFVAFTPFTEPQRSRKLAEYVSVLERSRLVREDTLCRDSMTEAERKWLRANRPAEARHWNLLTDMKAETLAHASL